MIRRISFHSLVATILLSLLCKSNCYGDLVAYTIGGATRVIDATTGNYVPGYEHVDSASDFEFDQATGDLYYVRRDGVFRQTRGGQSQVIVRAFSNNFANSKLSLGNGVVAYTIGGTTRFVDAITGTHVSGYGLVDSASDFEFDQASGDFYYVSRHGVFRTKRGSPTQTVVNFFSNTHVNSKLSYGNGVVAYTLGNTARFVYADTGNTASGYDVIDSISDWDFRQETGDLYYVRRDGVYRKQRGRQADKIVNSFSNNLSGSRIAVAKGLTSVPEPDAITLYFAMSLIALRRNRQTKLG